MTGFNNIKEIVDKDSVVYTGFRKTPTQVTASGIWFDISMSPGNPKPNYYASEPLVSAGMYQSVQGGVFHGADANYKALRELKVMFSAQAGQNCVMLLCDYLMYYPFIDESLVEEQPLINSVGLPRYPDGKGVQMMPVVVAGQLGGQSFYVTYTNSDGVAGRISKTVTCTTQAVNGTILTSGSAQINTGGPFIPLQDGDEGVRSVEAVTMLGGDVGLFSLVLVKPLATLTTRLSSSPVEIDYLKDFMSMPEIKNDAYLNFVCHPRGSLQNITFLGDATFIIN
jgi:hypothetical protein